MKSSNKKNDEQREVKNGIFGYKIPFSNSVIVSVLAFVFAVGGYGGYTVVKNYGDYDDGFENRVHLVSAVVDGDTIFVDDNVKVRLLGMNAPELDECFGEESRKYLSKIVLGRKVFLEKDQKATDQYGRLLRYVILRNENPEMDDVFVNSLIVKKGLAFSEYVKPNRRYLALLQAGEREAKANKIGMWGVCEFEDKKKQSGEMASEPENEDCVIKGNISKQYTKDYFLPGCPNYKRVKVDLRKGEKWFCTEEEAKEAGWRISGGCGNLRKE
jgi:micrococcal nuclease